MTLTARQIVRTYREWDTLTKVSFWIACVLLVIALVLLAIAPPEQRAGIFIGAVAIVIMMQLVVLWGNRGMVTVFTQAQRRYLAGDLEGARTLLEAARAQKSADMKALTLLGNTYRQLGMLDESRQILYEALDNAANHHFPLYNLGRTEAAAGNYPRAVELYEQALAAHAPPATQFDLAEALFLIGDVPKAMHNFEQVYPLLNEPHRLLMAQWWRYQLGAGDRPSADLIREGSPYWVALADRFHHTPYGKAIGAQLEALQNGVKGEAKSDV